MKPLTYAASVGAKQTNWPRVLKAAIKNEPTKKRHNELRNLAGGWPTCACGNQCAIIPRDGSGTPYDYFLCENGWKFYTSVLGRAWEDALADWYKIEERAAHLISEIAPRK